MIQSIWLIDGASGDVVIEKHYKGLVGRTSVELFWEQVAKCARRDDVPPIIPTTKYYLVNIYRGGMYFLATLTGEMPALLVLEFLHRVYDVLTDYFGEVTPRALTEAFSVAYQLLDEMLDNGFPLITEPNALHSLIAPPTILSRVTNFVTGKASNVSETLGAGAMSIIPWRRADVKYVQNEIYFDIVEEVDMIIESNGNAVASDVRGTITCNCRLSGVPDLTLVFEHPAVIEDASFHPCVRLSRWEREQVVSFVPPDGPFTLMTYRTNDRSPPMPLYVRPSVLWRDGQGRVSFGLGTKPMSTSKTHAMSSSGGMSGGGGAGGPGGGGGGPEIEDIVLTVVSPRAVVSVDLVSDTGRVAVDPRSNEVTWAMRSFPRSDTGARIPELTGVLHLAPGAAQPLESVYATLSYTVGGASVSGLGVRDLVLGPSEGYKFFKGVRQVLRTGRVTVRT